MNKSLLPPSANWYQTDVMACAPDNTLLYGARDDLIVIKPSSADEPEDVRCLPRVHNSKIISVNINKNWGSPHKYAVTVSQDGIVKVWDIETLERKCYHNKHLYIDPLPKLVGASFAGDDRVISVSQSGIVIIWDLIRNETNVLLTLFHYTKVEITCLSVCPHASWLVAFGLESGIVSVADLRKTGKILYSLRGHKKSVVSLAWCPAPVNIFPKRPYNRVVEKEPVECPERVKANDDSATAKSPETNREARVSRRKQTSPRKEPFSWTDYFYVDELIQCSAFNSYRFKMTPRFRTRKDKNSIRNASLRVNSRRKKKCNLSEYIVKMNIKITHPAEYWIQPKKEDETTSCQHGEDCSKCSPKEVVENWRTKQTDPCDEEPRKEFLLASSAREQQIYIWRAGTDGRLQTFMTVPTMKWRKTKRRETYNQKNWITLCWPSPQVLLSSSNDAALLHWTLPKPLDENQQFRSVHKEHWSALFTIRAPIVYLNEHNFLQQRELNVWTTGMDRKIVNTNLKTSKRLVSYPGLGGTVLCMAGSPLDPNRLAIGTGEPMLNIWDLGRPHMKNVLFSYFYHNLNGPITALAWHPTIETSLAWGSVYGEIGVLDMMSKSKLSKRLPGYFDTQIYKLEWGPLDPETEVQKLFVVAEGKIAIFDPKMAKSGNPELLKLPEDTVAYTMAWKPDYTKLLVSTKSGNVLTYSPDLQLLNVAYLTQKLQTILWHPDAVVDDFAVSQYCNMFAGTIKNNEFVVFDLNAMTEYNEETIVHQYPNRRKITCMAWSPHAANHLLFADEMGVAQIYDIESKTMISTYISPDGEAILSVHWSPSDVDLVIAGTISHKIYVWSVSEHPPMDQNEITVVRNKMVKALQKEFRDPQDISKEHKSSDNGEENGGGKSQKKQSIMPLFYSPKEDRQEKDLGKLLDWKLGKPTQIGEVPTDTMKVSEFSLKTKEGIIKFLEAHEPVLDPNDVDVLEVFGNQCDLKNLLKRNVTVLKQHSKYDKVNRLSLFQGDISEALKEAIEQKRVDPWIISMCPMVSPTLWQTACDMYVQQLLEDSNADPMEIVSYLLARHKVQEAVDFLCQREMFREAFVLAKSRFGADKEAVADVLDKWAKQCVYRGSFELAAACYITLGKLIDAASVLFRRTSVPLLEFAARLADMTHNEELHRAVKFRLTAFKTRQERIDEASNEDIRQKPLPHEMLGVSYEGALKDIPQVDLSIVKKEREETKLRTPKKKRKEAKTREETIIEAMEKELTAKELEEAKAEAESIAKLPKELSSWKDIREETLIEAMETELNTTELEGAKAEAESIAKLPKELSSWKDIREETLIDAMETELNTTELEGVKAEAESIAKLPKELSSWKDIREETLIDAMETELNTTELEGAKAEAESIAKLPKELSIYEYISEETLIEAMETELNTKELEEAKAEAESIAKLPKECSWKYIRDETLIEAMKTESNTKELEEAKEEAESIAKLPKELSSWKDISKNKEEIRGEEKIDGHGVVETTETQGTMATEVEKEETFKEVEGKREKAEFQRDEQTKKHQKKEFQTQEETRSGDSKMKLKTGRTNEPEGKTGFETEEKAKEGDKTELETEKETKKEDIETKLETKGKIGKAKEAEFQTEKETQKEESKLKLKTGRTNELEGKTGFGTGEKAKEGDKTELETEKKTKKEEIETKLETKGKIGNAKEVEQTKKDEKNEFQTEKETQKEGSKLKLKTGRTNELEEKTGFEMEKKEKEGDKTELERNKEEIETKFETKGKIGKAEAEFQSEKHTKKDEKKEFKTEKETQKEESKLNLETGRTIELEGKTGVEMEEKAKEGDKTELETNKEDIETKLETEGEIGKAEAEFQSEEQTKKDERKEFQTEKETQKGESKLNLKTGRTIELEGKTGFEMEEKAREGDKTELEPEKKSKNEEIETKLQTEGKIGKAKEAEFQSEEQTKKEKSKIKLKMGRTNEPEGKTGFETEENTKGEGKTGLGTEKEPKKEESQTKLKAEGNVKTTEFQTGKDTEKQESGMTGKTKKDGKTGTKPKNRAGKSETKLKTEEKVKKDERTDVLSKKETKKEGGKADLGTGKKTRKENRKLKTERKVQKDEETELQTKKEESKLKTEEKTKEKERKD